MSVTRARPGLRFLLAAQLAFGCSSILGIEELPPGSPAAGGGGHAGSGAGFGGGPGGTGGSPAAGGIGGIGGRPECPAGFELQGEDCVDIDECNLGTHNCVDEGSCNNTDGSFTCKCSEGQVGDALAGHGCQEITGLVLWLDGADPLDDQVPPPNDSSISTWVDRSGSGHDASQPTESPMPKFIGGGLNGHGVIRFSGANGAAGDELNIDNSDGAFDLTDAAIFIVAARRFTGTLSAAPGIFGVRSGAFDTRISLHIGAAGTNFLSWNGDTLQSGAPVPFQKDEFHLLDISWDAGVESMRVDQVLVSEVVHPWNSSATLLDVRVGWSGHSTEHFNGDIAELIVFEQPLSQQQRSFVLTYLNGKWGL